MRISRGLTSITKRDFYNLFHRAWKDSITPANILTLFNKCGIHPFNPNRVLNRFDDKTTERPSSSDSSTSVLSAGDWRKIERLLHEADDNIYDKKDAALSQALHSMSVETTLLRHENNQLKKALINEKKRRQSRRPLLLEQLADYHGGVIWYSPRKVQEARDLQAQKDEEKKQKEEAKQASRLLKEQQKKEKQIQAEERQRTRQIVREKKLEIEAQKRAQRKAKKEALEVYLFFKGHARGFGAR